MVVTRGGLNPWEAASVLWQLCFEAFLQIIQDCSGWQTLLMVQSPNTQALSIITEDIRNHLESTTIYRDIRQSVDDQDSFFFL